MTYIIYILFEIISVDHYYEKNFYSRFPWKIVGIYSLFVGSIDTFTIYNEKLDLNNFYIERKTRPTYLLYLYNFVKLLETTIALKSNLSRK